MIDYAGNQRDVLDDSVMKLRSPKVRLSIVALEIRNPVNDMKTQIYAWHDTGSQITMLRSPIARKLGLTGVTEQIIIAN